MPQVPHQRAVQPSSDDFQPLPPDAPGIPGVSSDPIAVTEDMKRGMADAAPSEGTGVTGCLRGEEACPPAEPSQPGGPA
jgi:hypothetical protein